MKIHEIAVQPRTETGSGAARRARKSGLVPAIVYSKHAEPKQIYLNAGDWASFARLNSHLLYLVDGSEKQAVLVKEIQMNHLKAFCLHVDFQAVHEDEKIHATISVHATGDCAGVTQGGVLEQNMHEIPVLCKPADMVEEIKVNIEKLGFGESIHLKDIELPAGIAINGDPEAVVFHVAAPESAKAEAETDAAAEPEAIKQKSEKADDKK